MVKKLNKQKDRVYLAALVLLLLLSIYALMGRGREFPPVNLFLESNHAFVAEDTSYIKTAPFWDNYSHWVDVSEGYVLNDSLLRRKYKGCVFLRYKPGAFNAFTSRALIGYLRDSSEKVIFLVDRGTKTDSLLKRFPDNRIFSLSYQLPMPLEEAKLNYAFYLDSSRVVRDIYVPRNEIPEVFEKYIVKKTGH